MSAPLIELDAIRKAYGGGDAPEVEVLHGVSLTIHAGEFVAIVGSSGSGKSTLMHLLGCLDRPTSGQYRFCGVDVAGLDADELAWLRREAFGFVFQGYHLIATESARENVEVPAIYAGMPAAEREARATALLSRLGLSARHDYRPNQLSGGQQQRVSIARALMNGGRIILADEPTGALDSQSGIEVMARRAERAAAGHPLILSPPDRAGAARARRGSEGRDGRVVADSGPDASRADGSDSGWLEQMADGSRTRAATLAGDMREACRAAWRVMWINRFRTALTLLGIVIGVASVIVMLAVGQGSKQRVLEQLSAFGANNIYLGPNGDSARQNGGRVTLEDAAAIRTVPNVALVMPYLEGQVVIRYGNLDYRAEGGGVSSEFPQALNWKTARGMFFSAEDERTMAKVVVIGERVRDALFKDDDPLGRRVLLDKVPFQVIGVLASKGAQSGDSDEDNRVVLPFSTASSRLYGNPYPSWLTIGLADGAKLQETEAAIDALMLERHRQRDFRMFNAASRIAAQAATSDTLSLLLALIAAVSLLVGGIGVMNIMLMTVRERTREIGIRMATGARQRDILRQFLTEAVLVSLVGGLAGVLIGLLVGGVLVLFGLPLIFSVTAMVGAFACALLTGLVFGYMPARQAARLDPVVALAGE